MLGRPPISAPTVSTRLKPGELLKRPGVVWWSAVAAFWLAFSVAPGSLGRKTHLFLGGLCAQRPDHSFSFDGQHLPFDARMTGIYLGSLATILALSATRRTRHAGSLAPATALTLGLFVAALAVDGINSLLVDLGRWHLYEPDNRVRLATGLLTGVSLGVVLVMLIASSVWLGTCRSSRPVVSPVELSGLAILALFIGALILLGGDGLFTPLAMLLLAGAVLTISALVLVCMVLIQAPYGVATSWRQLPVHGAKAMLIGLGVILVLGGLRLLAEKIVGPLDPV